MRYLIYLFLLLPYLSHSQSISGIVLEKKTDGKTEVIVGANIRWLNAKSGVSSNSVGKFMLAQKPENHQLIVSFVGYKTDTLMVHTTDYLTIFLEANTQLEGVTVRANATQIDQINPIHTEIINQKTLAKAACCNLSESFETNASISVNFTDAVTGAKQIQMLGLSGTYVQVNTENIPTIRGLATTFGLNFIPGTWITSIDVGKGAGSVVNGYEAMTGQINIELAKPETSEALYLNTYLNSFGRGEVNINLAHKLNSKWSVGLLTHASTQQIRLDKNGDGFLDLPLFTQYNAINRWKYQSDHVMLQAGVKVLYEDRLGGQSNFESALKGSPTIYGFGNTTKRVEFFSKTAWLFPEKPYKGIGLITNILDHQQNAFFGFKNYTGNQRTWYLQ